MTNPTFYWHDYETFGIDPQADRVCQFAGIRTDEDFNIIGDPLMLYCKTADDYLPHPEACLITGITPQIADQHGVCEAEFISQIHQQLAQANTCAVGYNSIRFDDEVTRNLLYRNFYDPYAREWQNGNSRWDLIDIARAAHALRPDGINWPLNDEGIVSFRLELLTQANDITHQAAHDALSDVYATIALARLIKQKQPKLYEFLYNNRHKTAALQLLKLGSFTPVVHVSGRFAARHNSMAVVLPLCAHPKNSNEIIVYDLSIEPSVLLELDAEQIQQRLFTASDALPEGISRIPLKTIHINKAPVIAPLAVITAADAERLQLNLAQMRAHAQQIASAPALDAKLAAVFTRQYPDPITDPDLMIYSGGFLSPKDKNTCNKIRLSKPNKLAEFAGQFEDDRLEQMLFRYQARNFPDSLNLQQHQQWQQFCVQRLTKQQQKWLTLADFEHKILSLQQQHGLDNAILKQLDEWAAIKRNQIQLTDT